ARKDPGRKCLDLGVGVLWPGTRNHGAGRSTGRNARWSRPIRGCKAAFLCGGGTRVPGQAIVDNFDYGPSVAEISEQLELPQVYSDDSGLRHVKGKVMGAHCGGAKRDHF